MPGVADGGGSTADPYGGGGGYVMAADPAADECPMSRLLNPWDWSALARLVTSARGVAQLVMSTAAVGSMLPFAYMEVCTAAVQG